jgi:aerobic carbon-monoxide dehydrogenase small subunit
MQSSDVSARGEDRAPAGHGQRVTVRFVLNGTAQEAEVDPWRTLAELLRGEEESGVTSVKQWCGEGECGTCTVLVDGRPVVSCLYPAARADGKSIRTVESLAPGGELHPLQDAFIRHDAIQCGFCTPGMLLSAVALLEREPRPNRAQVRAALAGNLCRCTGYQQIEEAVEAAARVMREKAEDAVVESPGEAAETATSDSDRNHGERHGR